MKRTLAAALLAASLFAPPSLAQPIVEHDGPIIIVPQVRRPPRIEAPAKLTAVEASIAINDQVATTTLDLSLTNTGTTLQQAQILLPVPDGVAVHSLQYDGVGPEPTASVLPRDEARKIYDSIVQKMRDPALVEFAGYNLIRTSAFPIPPGTTQHLKLTYEGVLLADGQRIDYWLPRSEALANPEVAWTINATLNSKRTITTVYSPSHEITTTRDGPGKLTLRAVNISQSDRGAFRFSFLTEPEKSDALSSTFMAYPDPSVGENGGYFLMLAALPPTKDNAPTMKREVVLVLDRSGSMRGEKIEQAKAAAIQVIDGLDMGEAFNIIDYSDSVNSFAAAPVLKDKDKAEEARAYIRHIKANGGTNIHDALIEALRPEPTKADGRAMLPLVLFLTDGLPTVGEKNEYRLREAVKKANTHHRRIFSFGVGFDVNSPLLSNIAKNSRAVSTFVLPNEDVEQKVSHVFRRLAGPTLASPKLTTIAGNGDTTPRGVRELMPGELADVFEGDQLLVVGQYTSSKPIRLRLEGLAGGKARTYDLSFDPTNATARNAFVPRLWARSKIAMLIDEVRQSSADGADKLSDARMKELTDEIIRLSKQHGILTEYTSFLAMEAGEAATQLGRELRDVGRATITGLAAPASSPARKEAEKQVADAYLRQRVQEDRAGSGGVNQDRNIQMMAGQTAAPAQRANVWYNSKNERVEVHTVQQVANLNFFRRGNRWVDSNILDKEGEKPDREVIFGSDEYNKLVTELTKTNQQAILAMDGEVYFLYNNQRVLVKMPS
jgi:Ca-activated chloride channel family protein